MAKIYTAQEMRIRATLEKNVWGNITTAEMLRQAADALEREEKREKKYEYGTMWRCDKSITRHGCLKDAVSAVQLVGKNKMHIVRREVGEWEEVKE